MTPLEKINQWRYSVGLSLSQRYDNACKLILELERDLKVVPAHVGNRIKFTEERLSYTVQARDERFIVCTKPFHLQGTVLYTIVDIEQQIRGPENLIFGAGAETREQCEEMLERLSCGKTEVTYRNRIPLSIEWVRE